MTKPMSKGTKEKLDPELQALVGRLERLHIPISEVCAEADLNHGTYYNWCRGGQAGFYTRQAFIEAGERLIEEKKQEYMSV